MDINTINRIVWWIPFKQLRNDIRDIIKINIELKDFINGKYLFNNWELCFIAPFRENIKNDKNFLNKYRSLISNLDEESIDTVNNIISKLSNFNNINDDIYFYDDEIKIIKEVEKYMS